VSWQPATEDLVEEVVALRDGELTVLRPRDSEALLDDEAFAADEFLPYWAELWPSGLALARRLAGRALHGARVVELGCGLGLPSLAAARGQARVLATDWSQPALDLLQHTAAANGLGLETARVDWREPDTLLARGPFALVLAADVLYERRNVSLMLSLLPRLGSEIWLADPGRSFAEAFLEAAPRLFELDTTREDGVYVHRLVPRRIAR
jgi:predicted nicotinamide N-methyase